MRAITLSLCSLFWACSGEDTTSEPEEQVLQVYSFSYPVSYLVERLAEDTVDHQCILPAGEDAASWKPSNELIIELQQADVLFSNGLGFEGWVKTAALPTSKLIEAASTVDPIRMEGKTHSHGKGGAHSHGEIDPHAWSDPQTYGQMAAVVAKALIKADPSLETSVQANLESLQQDLNTLHKDYTTVLQGLKTVTLAANHPSFSYLMRAQGLEITSFDFDPEGDLDAKELEKFTTWTTTHPNPLVLWEAQPQDSVQSHDAFVNAKHFFIDPLEGPVDGKFDYVAQVKANQERFQAIVTATTTTPEAP